MSAVEEPIVETILEVSRPSLDDELLFAEETLSAPPESVHDLAMIPYTGP